MSIEVRELVIKATIVPENSNSAGSAGGDAANNNVSPSEAMINACVEKILEIIKDKHGR
ncbi:MAG: hypothetical protein JST75_02100 [Bacteroidetes bacterium]|nr:hypothetical protein [Bacteroidota bacterium]